MALPPMGLFQPHTGSQWPGCGQRSRGQGRPLPSAGRLPRPLPDKGCRRGPWGRQRPHHGLVSSSSEASAGQGAKSEHRKPPVTAADSPPLGAPPWDGRSARERVGPGPCPPGPACAQGVRLCRSAAEGGGPVCLHFIAPKPGQVAKHGLAAENTVPAPAHPILLEEDLGGRHSRAPAGWALLCVPPPPQVRGAGPHSLFLSCHPMPVSSESVQQRPPQSRSCSQGPASSLPAVTLGGNSCSLKGGKDGISGRNM